MGLTTRLSYEGWDPSAPGPNGPNLTKLILDVCSIWYTTISRRKVKWFASLPYFSGQQSSHCSDCRDRRQRASYREFPEDGPASPTMASFWISARTPTARACTSI